MDRFDDSRAGKLAAAALLLVQAGAPTALLAQDKAASAGGLEEITVTARRREESLQDVPIAVTAFSAENLAQTGAFDITALQQTTPNLTLQVARGSNSTLIAFIRGIGQQDPLWGFEPGVGLYIDDVYIARPQGAVLDVYDIDRIEVLRGPQGTLYGRNTIGGAVKYVTAKIGAQPQLTAKVNLGSYKQHDVIVSASGRPTDAIGLSATGAIFKRDGFGTNLVTGAEEYNKDVKAFRVTGEFSPTDKLFFRLSGDTLRDDSNAKHGHREAPGSGLSAGEPVLSNVYDSRAGIGDRNRVKNDGVSLLAQYELSDALTLKSITAYREGSTRTVIDFDTGPTPALDVPGLYDDNQFTQELQVVYGGKRVQAVGGLFYMDAAASGAFDTVVGIANLSIATAGEVKTKSWAAFTDISVDLAPMWSLSVGGRYTSDDKTGFVWRRNFTGLRSPLFGGTTAIPGLLRTSYTNKRTFSEFTPRASLSFKPTDELNVYLSWGRGFKSGGFDMRGDAYVYPATVNGYDPETVDTLELGAKTTLAGGKVRLAGAIFDSKYKNQQITSQFALPTTPPTVVSFVDNAASSKIRGAELEGTLVFNEYVSTTFQVGYLDTKFDEFITYDAATNTRRDLASQRKFQNTPKTVYAINVALRRPFAGGEIAFIPAVAYRDKVQFFETAIPVLDQGSYTLVDASLTWTSADQRTTLGLYGRNLTDERYRIAGYYFPGATFGNVVNGFYGPPRTWTLSGTYKFGGK